MKHLPHKTIERLSQYRRALLLCHAKGKTHIYSHEIAKIQHITAVQVRRDIMLIGYTGTLRKGYNVKELIDLIGQIIDSEEGINVCVVGIGNLAGPSQIISVASVQNYQSWRYLMSIKARSERNITG